MARAFSEDVYRALAADYDGTLAEHGRIAPPTWAALRRLVASGRAAVLVTGRQLEELLGLLEYPEVFARIVAENGALLYEPAGRGLRELAPPPPPMFVDDLFRCNVPFRVGRAIVATREPYGAAVRESVAALGLPLDVILNKGAVMVLPAGIDKGSGVRAALAELAIAPADTVGVGDAENDAALLAACGCGVALANAVPSLIARADVVTAGADGAGIVELIDAMLAGTLATASSADSATT